MTRTRSITHEGSTIRYTVVRSARRKKTLTITIDPANGVRVLVPARTPYAEIESMVRKRAGWILRKLTEERPEPRPRRFVTGEKLYYLGRELPLVVQLTTGEPPSVSLEADSSQNSVPGGAFGGGLSAPLPSGGRSWAWYRERAAELLAEVRGALAAGGGRLPGAHIHRRPEDPVGKLFI